MRRTLVRIDRDKCDGCGICAQSCLEGAIVMVGGKAELSSEFLCDGLGACLKVCPRGAISLGERESAPYDEEAVLREIAASNPEQLPAHLRHLAEHAQWRDLEKARLFFREKGLAWPEDIDPAPSPEPRRPVAAFWPIQLQLLSGEAPFLEDADLLVFADCVPAVTESFRKELLRERVGIMFCPKLDRCAEEYVSKLAEIFATHRIRSIRIAMMEVPCCRGVRAIVAEALSRANVTIPVAESVIAVSGEIRDIN